MSAAQDAPIPHRVYRIPESLRGAIGAAREKRELTIRGFIAEAVQQELPDIIDLLTNLGIEKHSELRPVRWPVDPAVLQTLAYASEQTGIDQSKLLLACLFLASNRKRRRPTAPAKE